MSVGAVGSGDSAVPCGARQTREEYAKSSGANSTRNAGVDLTEERDVTDGESHPFTRRGAQTESIGLSACAPRTSSHGAPRAAGGGSCRAPRRRFEGGARFPARLRALARAFSEDDGKRGRGGDPVFSAAPHPRFDARPSGSARRSRPRRRSVTASTSSGRCPRAGGRSLS